MLQIISIKNPMPKTIDMYPKHPNRPVIIVLIILAIVVMVNFLTGCSTAKQLIDKAEKKDAAAVAKYTREKYPCTDLLKPDTTTIYQDSLIYIDCPDSVTNGSDYTDGKVIIKYDTINNVVTRVVKVPVHLQSAVKYITKWYEDSAKLKLNSLTITGLQSDTAALRIDRDKYKAKAERRGKENWIWRAIALVLIAWQIIKLYRFFTTIKIKS